MPSEMEVPLQHPINDFGHIYPSGLYGDIIGQFGFPFEYFEDHTGSFGDPTGPFQALLEPLVCLCVKTMNVIASICLPFLFPPQRA